MPVSQELLEILVCPVASGSLRNRGGRQVESAPSEGLVREDGRILYPVEDDIPVMLIEESFEL